MKQNIIQSKHPDALSYYLIISEGLLSSKLFHKVKSKDTTDIFQFSIFDHFFYNLATKNKTELG